MTMTPIAIASNSKDKEGSHLSSPPIARTAPCGVIGNRGGGGTQQYRRDRRHNRSQSRGDAILESFRSTLSDARLRLDEAGGTPPEDRVSIPAFVSGTLAFYATAFSSQYVQHRCLRISTGTRPAIIPATAGAVTVALGSWMGHLAGLGVASAWRPIQRSWRESDLLRNVPRIAKLVVLPAREMMRPMYLFAYEGFAMDDKNLRRDAWLHAARVCVLGLLAYKVVFRSRFSSISPSSYTARGSFARVGIPAPPNFNYATRPQRAEIERIGRRWGCHTCGSRMMFSKIGTNKPKFHGDHIPPVSVAKQLNERWYRRALGRKVSQKFYPQCRDCSNKQGGLLAKAIGVGHRNLRAAGGGEESYFHGRRMRIGHFTGGTVAVAALGQNTVVQEGEEGKIAASSRRKLLSIQDWMEDLCKGSKE